MKLYNEYLQSKFTEKNVQHKYINSLFSVKHIVNVTWLKPGTKGMEKIRLNEVSNSTKSLKINFLYLYSLDLGHKEYKVCKGKYQVSNLQFSA